MPRAFCESVLRHGRLLLSVSHMKSLQKRSFKRHAGSFGRQKHEGTQRALQTVIESTNYAACGEANGEIGRASCRERVCTYVKLSVISASLQKKRNQQTTIEQS